MSLVEHLRELRRRLVISAAAILVGSVVGWNIYDWLYARISEPIDEQRLTRRGGEVVTINFAGLTDGFAMQVNVSLFAGIIMAAPVWILQLWGFIVPGLTKKEKWTARFFMMAAVPLFLAGCFVAYLLMPKAVGVLMSFVPAGGSNIIAGDVYLQFVLKFILAFGLSFLLPAVLVGLNLAHVLPARTMRRGWRLAVILAFVFGAVMTPTTDPWTMTFLAGPVIVLYFAAVGIASITDRRRAAAEPDWLNTPDGQASAL